MKGGKGYTRQRPSVALSTMLGAYIKTADKQIGIFLVTLGIFRRTRNADKLDIMRQDTGAKQGLKDNANTRVYSNGDLVHSDSPFAFRLRRLYATPESLSSESTKESKKKKYSCIHILYKVLQLSCHYLGTGDTCYTCYIR